MEGVNFPQFKADVIFNQQEYNEEDDKSRFYLMAREWEGKVVLEKLNWEQKLIGLPLPKVVAKYVDVGAYLTLKGEVEFIYSKKYGRKNYESDFKQLERDGKAQGVLGLGGRVTAGIKKGFLLTADANGGLKSEIELYGGLRKEDGKGNDLIYGGSIKPVILTLDIKLAVSKTDWSPEVELLNMNYVKNLTNEIALFPNN